MIQLIPLLLIIEVTFGHFNENPLFLEYQWSYIDFDWPTLEMKQKYIDNGVYNYSKIVASDVDREKCEFLHLSKLNSRKLFNRDSKFNFYVFFIK